MVIRYYQGHSGQCPKGSSRLTIPALKEKYRPAEFQDGATRQGILEHLIIYGKSVYIVT